MHCKQDNAIVVQSQSQVLEGHATTASREYVLEIMELEVVDDVFCVA